jgi:cytochrome c551/c552
MSRTMVALSMLCLLAWPVRATETETGKALVKYCGACHGPEAKLITGYLATIQQK